MAIQNSKVVFEHVSDKPTRHIIIRQDIVDENPQNSDWIIHFDASFSEADYTMGFAICIMDTTGERRCIKAGSSWEACP